MTNKTRTFQSGRLWAYESSSVPSIVCLLAVLFVWSILVTNMASAEGLPQWRVLPIRSEEEYRRGEIGGEAEQHPHSIARCRNQPDVIYFSHDCKQAWSSKNAGETWKHVLGKGLYLNQGQSIEVDPVDPNIVFLLVDDAWNHLNRDSQGLYRSSDGGQTWQFLLPLQLTHNSPKQYQHTIAYDPASIQGGKAMRWYVATNSPTLETGLFRSDDGGDSWTESLGLEREIKSTVFTEGKYHTQWPAQLMFNNVYTDNAVLTPLLNFKIMYRFVQQEKLDRIELYQGDWVNSQGKGTYAYAKDLLIEFGDGTSVTHTLKMKPEERQVISLGVKRTKKMDITITSIYANPDYPDNKWGGIKEIEVINTNGQDVSVWEVRRTIIYDIECHPTDGKTVYAATDSGLYLNTNRGETTTLCGGQIADADITSIEVVPGDPVEIYAVVRNGGLYRSEDGGNTFSKIASCESLLSDTLRVFVNPGYPDVIYLVGNNSGAIVSSDAGATWRRTTTEPALGLGRESDWKGRIAGELTGIVPNPANPNEAVGFSRSTLWKTTNAVDGSPVVFKDSSNLFTGYSWAWWNDGIAFDRYNPNRFATFNADVGTAITYNGGDFFERRIDVESVRQWRQEGRISWMSSCSGDFQPVAHSQIIVASIGSGWSKQLMLTTDEGVNWELAAVRDSKGRILEMGRETSENNLFIAFHPGYQNIVYAGDKISTDAGATFDQVDFGNFSGPSILGICCPDPDDLRSIYIFAVDENKRVLRSRDKLVSRDSWELLVEADWRFKKIDSKPTFAVHPTDPDKVYAIDADGDLAVYNYRTMRWSSLGILEKAGGIEYGNHVRSVAIDPRHPEIIYAGMFSAGIDHVWRSTDFGETWTNITENLPRAGIASMAVNPHTGELLTGSTFGTWVFPPPYDSSNLIYNKCIVVSSD